MPDFRFIDSYLPFRKPWALLCLLMPCLSLIPFSLSAQTSSPSFAERQNTTLFVADTQFTAPDTSYRYLPLETGDIVVVLDYSKDKSGWWYGHANGSEGFFPGHTISWIPDSVFKAQRTGTYLFGEKEEGGQRPETVQNDSDQPIILEKLDLDIDLGRDFSIEAKVVQTKGQPENLVGFFWGDASDSPNIGMAAISYLGTFGYGALEGGYLYEYIPFQSKVPASTSVSTEQPPHLMAQRKGRFITFFINGEFAGVDTFQKVAGKNIGFFVGNRTTVHFHEVKVFYTD